MGSYRAVLEVAKYCGPQDVLKHCREVSSVWAQAGLSNELWDLYSDTFGFPSRHSSESAFQAYVRGKTQGYTLALFVRDEVVLYDCLTGLTERWKGLCSDRMSNWVLYLNKVIRFGGSTAYGGSIATLGTAHMYGPNNHCQLQTMITPRFFHNGIIFQGELYVFGGLNGQTPLNATEKLSLKQQKTISAELWRSLSNSLHKRSNVSLCIDLKYIYICGGGSEVERYCPRTDTYLDVFFKLALSAWTAGVVYGSKLLLLSGREVIQTDLQTKEINTSPVSWAWGNYPAMNVVTEDKFLYRVSERGIDRYDIATYTSIPIIASFK